ncbi:MAG: ribonuclease P protein component 1 [Candidatus Micrarchaeia archaeon]
MPNYNNKTIVIHELSGLSAQVLSSSDKNQKGIKGKVIKETKNMLVLNTSKGIKQVVKKTSTFKFFYGKDSFTVKGEEINFRPYERTEKALKFYKRRKA